MGQKWCAKTAAPRRLLQRRKRRTSAREHAYLRRNRAGTRLEVEGKTGATVLRSTSARRRVLVAHLPELANVAAGSLLFGQFLADRTYSVGLAVLDVAAWFGQMGIVFLFADGESL
jgi:hypothetical protein